MKRFLLIFLIPICLSKTNGLQAQNQLRINAYASSALSEGSFSWFMDTEMVSGSQLTIQVTDQLSGAFIGGCDVSLKVFSLANPGLSVQISSREITEVRPGLYIFRGSTNNLFNAVTMKAGVLIFNINVAKQGYPQVTLQANFSNQDFLGGFVAPPSGMWLNSPRYLIVEDQDPSVMCNSPHGQYYSVIIDYIDKNNKPQWLIVPVEKSTHKIPAKWLTYQQAAKALAVASHYDSFKLEPVMSLDKDLESMQKMLPAIKLSGKAIDFLVPVLNKLVLAIATGGSSIYYDAKKMIATELAHFLLSKATDPVAYAEGYFFHQTKKQLQEARDTLKLLTIPLRSMEHLRRPLDFATAEKLYRQWRFVLINSQIISELAENNLVGVGRKLLETQIETVIGSQIPYQMKLLNLARFIETRERSLVASFEKSTKAIEALYISFERHWDEEGDARWMHRQIGGKAIREASARNYQQIRNFKCSRAASMVELDWDLPSAPENPKYVIKFNNEPITDQNWHLSYFLELPSHISSEGGKMVFRPSPKTDIAEILYYGIRLYDQRGLSSHLSSSGCLRTSSLPIWVDKKVEAPSGAIADLTDPFSREMVFVKGGCFIMGTNNPDYANAKPAHEVCLDNFYISSIPVTQRQWVDIMGSNPSRFKNCLDCPVENVSWNDVQHFINKLNEQTGKNYRLPTEAEWEYAALGGRQGNNSIVSNAHMHRNIAWFVDNSGGRTRPVKRKQPNRLGLYDMIGNVFEWCNDWYAFDYYQVSPHNNPKGPMRGSTKVIRGGAWSSETNYLFSYYRASLPPNAKLDNCGFRLVVDAL